MAAFTSFRQAQCGAISVNLHFEKLNAAQAQQPVHFDKLNAAQAQQSSCIEDLKLY